MNVCFETFGCRLNRAEALEDEAKCLDVGHKIVTDHQQADFFVVRGCSVTSKAQHECEKLIEHLKRKYPYKRVFVTGCLEKAKPLIIRRKEGPPPLPTRTARAYLKVQNGCAGKCTFCIVPRFRGTSESERFDLVVDKAKRYIDAGYHEIVLTGCNLSMYANGGQRLPELVAELAELDPTGCRIRLGSLEPCLAAEEAVAAMAEHANVCRFLHLPIQSGSDRILAKMRRPYHVDGVEKLILLARKSMPTVNIGCDMIAGFPGESTSDAIASESLLTRMKIVNVHSFPFSRRPGTPAATMPGQLPHDVVLARARSLTKLGDTNRRAFAHRFLGKRVQVVIESSEHAAGWTDEYLWFEETKPEGGEPETPPERRQAIGFIVNDVHGGRLFGVRG